VALLEAADYGSGASGNSLRILHAGLRYLQSADLIRFAESVAERRWYAHTFPELVAPLPCLMPLYASGMKRLSVMRLALAAMTGSRGAAMMHLRRLCAAGEPDIRSPGDQAATSDGARRRPRRGGALV